MAKFIINFYAPDEHGKLQVIAKTEATGDHDYEAAAVALKELKPQHPEVTKNLWISEGPARR
ncbi:MAG: hypothetical protein BWK76_21180 [Desulfobulbaceae bacterium A2]|nr:MAG: hypothetical protein BWK76_21180 [Desulfobulbaceae bacterium A2]